MDPLNLLIGKQVADIVHHIPGAHDANFTDTLNSIITHEEIGLIFSNPDAELEFTAAKRELFEAPFFVVEKDLAAIFLDKERTVAFLKDTARLPTTIPVRDSEDLQRQFPRLKPPVWLRATGGAGGRGSILLEEPETGAAWLHYWRKRNWNWMIQEYLPGRNYNWTGVLHRGHLVTSGALERLDYLMGASTVSGISGNIRSGRTIHDTRLNEIGRLVCERLSDSDGVISIDLREDREGIPNITEVNIRFAARPWLYTSAGANFPAAIVDLIEGQKVKLPQYNAPRKNVLEIRQVDATPVIVDNTE